MTRPKLLNGYIMNDLQKIDKHGKVVYSTLSLVPIFLYFVGFILFCVLIFVLLFH